MNDLALFSVENNPTFMYDVFPPFASCILNVAVHGVCIIVLRDSDIFFFYDGVSMSDDTRIDKPRPYGCK